MWAAMTDIFLNLSLVGYPHMHYNKNHYNNKKIKSSVILLGFLAGIGTSHVHEANAEGHERDIEKGTCKLKRNPCGLRRQTLVARLSGQTCLANDIVHPSNMRERVSVCAL